MKAIKITLLDENNAKRSWLVDRVPRAVNCLIGSSRVISGWEYKDHEGYTRFSEGNWLNLVTAVRSTAENYGLKANIS